jgi:hypothetical protein
MKETVGVTVERTNLTTLDMGGEGKWLDTEEEGKGGEEEEEEKEEEVFLLRGQAEEEEHAGQTEAKAQIERSFSRHFESILWNVTFPSKTKKMEQRKQLLK